MKPITIQEWCELELFMIAHNYTGKQIREEKAKYIITKEIITLKGDMAQQFNQDEEEYFDEQDPMGL